MTEQYYFETRTQFPKGVSKRICKLRNSEQLRRQKAIETRQREAAQIRSTIASLNLTVSMLDSSIAADLETASVRDPRHYAYPISARTTMSRRDNLKATISALSKRLELF
jgi:DNA-binding protein H-NS